MVFPLFPINFMPKNVLPIHRYKLYSQLWGECQAQPYPFNNKWQRLRAVAKEVRLSHDAKRRLDWIIWYETKGNRNARATCRHFGIAPKTFYTWLKRFDDARLVSLEDRSHRPHAVRMPTITPEAEQRVIALRKKHLYYSKIKLSKLYEEQYGTPMSSWKIQRVIQQFKLYPNRKKAARVAAKRRRAHEKKRITELSVKKKPGFLFGLDTIVIHLPGAKRYILTAIDRFSRLAFARMYTSHSSLQAADFLRRLYVLVGGELVHVQTDNGSEFHKHFRRATKDLKLQHWWSRVKTPKDNAVCERFNRTIQEEFIGRGNLYTDPAIFNHKLTEWLVEYDFHRPHAALGYKRPIEIACPDHQVLPIYSSRTFP